MPIVRQIHWVIEVIRGTRSVSTYPDHREAFGYMEARIPEREGRTQPGDFIAYQRLPEGVAPTC